MFRPPATFFCQTPQKKAKGLGPAIRPRLRRGSFAPSPLRGSAYKGRPWPFKPLAASMPLAPLRNDSTHPPERAIRAPETMGLIQLPWWFAIALLLPEHSQLHLSYPGFRRVQSPPRRANGIVVEEVERHGCRESHGGPWMAHRRWAASGRASGAAMEGTNPRAARAG